jgi:hypothetical protein
MFRTLPGDVHTEAKLVGINEIFQAALKHKIFRGYYKLIWIKK